MALMQSTSQEYTKEQEMTLLNIGAQSILHGLKHGTPLEVFSFQYDPPLQDLRATFVTLEKYGELRGCIGTLKAIRPLVEDVAYNAFAAAFSDPRFAGLHKDEFDSLDMHISILTPAEDFPVDSEADLLRQIVPGKDGLILSDGPYKSTFLPSVWESLPTPQLFLSHLKQKAGLSAEYWSDTIRFQRYQTIAFGLPVKELTLEKD